mgnify:CR=1 FL=1
MYNYLDPNLNFKLNMPVQTRGLRQELEENITSRRTSDKHFAAFVEAELAPRRAPSSSDPADKAVRQALYLAMNRKARLEAIYHGRPIETESYVPHGHWAFDDGLPKHSHDPAAAKALLDKAGWLTEMDRLYQTIGGREFLLVATRAAQALADAPALAAATPACPLTPHAHLHSPSPA